MKPMLPSSSHSLNQLRSSFFSNSVAFVSLLGALFSAPCFADEFADVNKHVKAGQYADALAKADSFLTQHPRDAQMRFLKGLILTEQNKPAEAIAIFTKLTEDFPDLPEPYNNLAVLFAASAQYDKARASLEMAIRTNPTYATAHENLGDVYAKLASQAYDKALQLDSGNSVAKSKLTMVRTLIGNTNGGTNPKATNATAAPVIAASTKTVAPAPVTIAKAEPPKVEVKPETKPLPKIESRPEIKPVVKSNADDTNRDEVLRTVNNWAKEWSSKDVKGYLSYYGNDFQTPKGESRKEWADERRSRIEGKGRIQIKIDSPTVNLNGNVATVKFRQTYTSDRLTASSKKTLLLEKQGGKWLIKQEHAGS
jgi:tetratricopeptide (TPR) repeat protein